MYYFIYYKCKRFSTPDPINRAYTITESECTQIIDTHPIQFQIDCNEKYGQPHEEHGYEVKEEYKIISWQELTKEDYERYWGMI